MSKKTFPLAAIFIVIFLVLVGVSSLASAAPNAQDPEPTPTYFLSDPWNYSFSYLNPNTHEQFSLNPALISDPDMEVAGIWIQGSGQAPGNGALKIFEDPNFSMKTLLSYTDGASFNKCWDNNNYAGANPCQNLAGVYTGDELGLDNQLDNFFWDTTGNYSQIEAEVTIRLIYYGIPPECTQPDPEDLPVWQSATLLGTDPVGYHYDLTEGKTYYLYFFGGPWNDGTDDRYDAVLSWDGGENWEAIEAAETNPLDDLCNADLGENYTGVTFTADADHLGLDLRVNDGPDDMDFADNSGDLSFAIALDDYKLGETGCGQNYQIGSLAAEYSEDPSSSFHSSIPMGDREFYRILVPHSWQDGSQYQTKLQIQNSLSASGWYNLEAHPNTVCVEDHDLDPSTEAGWISYYFRADAETNFYDYLAQDLSGSYGDNSGIMDVEIYESTYNPSIAPCSSKYRTDTTIEGVIVFATQANGYRIPNSLDDPTTLEFEGLTPGQYYSFEEPTTWAGWTDGGGDPQFDWQISPDGSTWEDIDTAADCVEKTSYDHHTYYLQADHSSYSVRVKDGDGSFANNTGTLKLNLKAATLLEQPADPIEGTCPNFQLGAEIASGGFLANLNYSDLPDVIDPQYLYSIELDYPGWTDGGVTGQNTADIWTGVNAPEDFASYSGALCVEADEDGFPRMFIKGVDENYYLRADSSPGDNSANVNYTIREVNWVEDPRSGSCLHDYNPSLYVDYPTPRDDIPAQWQGGVYLNKQGLNYGSYKIITSGGPWKDFAMPVSELRYDVEISYQNGAVNSWQDLSEAAECYVPTLDETGQMVGAQAFITIAEGEAGMVKLRANNEDGIWIDNTDAMDFRVEYNPMSNPNPEDPYDDPTPYISGGCDLDCLRPTGVSVPAWLEYFRCQLVKRMAFCDYHWEVVRHMRQLFQQREPFGSIRELAAAFGLVRQTVRGFAWVEDGGGDPADVTVSQPQNFIFAPEDGGGASIPLVGDASPWGEGDINILGEGAEFDTTCNNNMAAALGARLAGPICFGFNALDSLGIMSWFQLFWDLVMIIAAAMYYNNRWVKPMQS